MLQRITWPVIVLSSNSLQASASLRYLYFDAYRFLPFLFLVLHFSSALTRMMYASMRHDCERALPACVECSGMAHEMALCLYCLAF